MKGAKQRAKEKNLPFNIDLADIRIPEFCPVFGIKLGPVCKGGDDAPSLDRIRPELGYVKGNVQVISDRANRLKSDATAAELRIIADFLDRLLKL